MSSYQFITTELIDGTSVISLNRPEVYNALNFDSKMEIISAIREANKDQSVSSIILTGKGKAFCTGQDLTDRSIQADTTGVDLGHTLETEWMPLINSIRDSRKIVIAAINGVCAGAGVSVALACDLTITTSENKFMGAFSKLGLVPDAGSTYMFTRGIGFHKTMEFFLLGEPLMGQYLFDKGMINKISTEPLKEALTFASSINQLAPMSVELIKKNIKLCMDMNFSESLQMEKAAQRFLGHSNDYKEGLDAFLKKRKPIFKGH